LLSYSQEVKREICRNRALRHDTWAMAYGMLLYGKCFSSKEICLHTEHQAVARLYGNLLSDLVHLQGCITAREVKRSGRKSMFLVTVDEASDREAVIACFGGDGNLHQELLNEENEPAFLSGAFLSCGAVSDPKKGYHAEFVTPHKILAEALTALLSPLALPKMTARRNNYIIYYKESGHIEDLLTYIGAPKSAMQMMEIKIVKGLRNQVNRTINCETANISKTVDAALHQIEAIRRIEQNKGISWLEEDLQPLAILRMNHPELSLRELGETLSMSRSTVNRKLQKIMEISEKLKSI